MTIDDAIQRSAFAILEDGLFLFLDPDDAGGPAEGVAYTMAIEGGAPAEVGLVLEPAVARQLAAGMLGVDEEEIDDPTGRASVAEALNMLAGHLVALVEGDRAERDLCPPVEGGSPRGHVAGFQTDGGRLTLWYAS